MVVSTKQRRLYYVLGGGAAVRYGVGVGREGFSWSGVKSVTMKKECRIAPAAADARPAAPTCPATWPGRPGQNPLGARAMYLGSPLYRIHGSNEPETMGAAVSRGLHPHDEQGRRGPVRPVKVGTKVVVRD